MFCTLSVTEKLLASRTVAGGLVTLVSVRSGPETVVLVVEALQLLLSFVSGRNRVSSAEWSTNVCSPAVPALTVTVTVPLEVALEASEGTARLPVSRRGRVVEVMVVREERVVAAETDALPMFWTVSVKERLMSYRTVAGGFVTFVWVR